MIWTWLDAFISYGDNRYATLKLMIYTYTYSHWVKAAIRESILISMVNKIISNSIIFIDL